MKQYRITSSEFRLPGDSGDPDAWLSEEDMAMIKASAGVTGLLAPAILSASTPRTPPAIIREQKYDGRK